MNDHWLQPSHQHALLLQNRGQVVNEFQTDMHFRWNLMSLVREFELQGPVEDSVDVNRGVVLQQFEVL